MHCMEEADAQWKGPEGVCSSTDRPSLFGTWSSVFDQWNCASSSYSGDARPNWIHGISL